MVAAVAGSLRLFHGDGAGAFGAPVTLTVSANPVNVVVADFNEDGVADIAVGHSTGSAISILNSDGQGGFAAAVQITTQAEGRVYSFGDVNEDGNLDLIVRDGPVTAQRVTLLPGNGAGGFAAEVVVMSGFRVTAPMLADLNGDGNLDIVARDIDASSLVTQLGDGTGGFAAAVRFVAPTFTNPVPVDLTGDGRVDIAVGGPDGGLRVLRNTCGQAEANLSLSVTDSPDPVANGAQLTYTLEVTNNGPNGATSVFVTDVLPSGISFLTATPSQGTCGFDAFGTVQCLLGEIPSAGIATITITARALSGGAKTNSATVAAAEYDPTQADNSGFETTTVNAGAVTLTVLNTNDSGPGSLRQAIVDANTNVGQLDTIAFDINPPGLHVINVPAQLPTISDAVVIDGTTQPGYDGIPVIQLAAVSGGGGRGIQINSGGSTIRGLSVTGFSGSGIAIQTGGLNVIEGNYIGVTPAGVASGNVPGVSINSSAGNRIGGTVAAQRNLISGNTASVGININGAASTGNFVLGNFIGLNPAGTAAVPNNGGIVIQTSASANVIGGTVPGSENVISGSANLSSGVSIVTGATANIVQGNRIGTDAAGTIGLPNGGAGVFITAPGNTIGGDAAGAGNLISGNVGSGIRIDTAAATGNIVRGNVIGPNLAGTAALPNNPGVHITGGASGTIVGGVTPATRNVISGNTNGIIITGSPNTVVEGNHIGTTPAGTGALGNVGSGVFVQNGATGTRIGGVSAGARNLISGNQGSGVVFLGDTTTGNVVQGNFIGTTVGGTGALPNLGIQSGVFINGAPNNTVGGTAPGAGNVVSGNANHAVTVVGPAAIGNVIQGNFIGTDPTGTIRVANVGIGVDIVSATNTIIGGPGAARNVISGNGLGIQVRTNASGTVIRGNNIGTNAAGTAPISNGPGIFVNDSATGTIIGGAAAGQGNLISGNTANGIQLTTLTTGTVIHGNRIGTDTTGTLPLGNGFDGISITQSSNTTIGGAGAGEANVIAFNSGRGVNVLSGTGNRISRNSISGNTLLGIDLDANQVTPNDPGDGDTGANNRQNFPVLTSATLSGGQTTVEGTLNSTAQTQFTIEFFTNAACDTSGNGEGQTFIGSTTVTTDANGNASFQAVVGPATIVTATATDPNGNTAEFSGCIAATASALAADLRVATTDAPDPVLLNGELIYTVTVTNDGPSPATGVRLTQTLGAGVTFLSSSVQCDVSAQAADCSIGTLASGASTIVTIQVRATAAGVHASTSTVDGVETDPTANNVAATSTAVVSFGPCLTGTFGPPVIYPAGRNTEIAALGDFNEDGFDDVVATNDTGNPRGIQLLIGNGDGTFDPPVYFQAGADGIAVGDFDRDGNLDLATGNENDQVTVLYGNGAGGFPRVTRIPTGLENPFGPFAADLTGDGFLDFVIGVSSDGAVAHLLRNDGAGGFLAPVPLPSGIEVTSVVLDDFNGDGFVDVATSNGGGNTISVLRNNGTGLFTEVSRLSPGPMLGIRSVGDLNGDGRPDIVFGRIVTGGAVVSLYFNSATGTFTGPVDIGPVSVELHDGAAADVTGDGFKDFVTFTGSTVLVMRGDGAGNFGPPVAYAVGTDPGSLTLGDVDDDGRFDILLAQENAGLAVLLNRCGTQTGSANLSATMTDSQDPVTPGTEVTYTITVTNHGPDVATGVVVNDALPAPSFVFAGMVSGACTFVGDDAMTCPVGTIPVDGTASIVYRVRAYNGPRTNAATAIGNQADPDFSDNTAVQTTTVTPPFPLCGDGNGSFASPTNFAAGSNAYMSALGDFNEDGVIDLVVTDASTAGRVAFLRGNGNGTFQAPVFVTVGSNPNGIVAADFDNDGNLDFATANQLGNSVSIGYGDGSGGFPAVSTIPVGAINPFGIATADLTGDGNLDLVIGAQAAGSVARLLVGVPANRDFTPQIALPSGQMPREVVLEDYNGDGFIDIVTGNGANATISVLTNNGTGTFTATATLNTGANPRVRRTGDLNSDGRPDIMFVSGAVGGNAVSVYLSAPGGGFAGPTEVIPASFGPFHGATADVNGDGFLDIANIAGGTMSVFIGHGDGTFHFTGNHTFGPASNTLTVGDVNGDARPDILVARAGSGQLSVFLNRCGAQTGTAELSVVKTDSADPVAVNSLFTYTIAVTNHGPDVATNVVVTDSLPAPNIQFVGMVTGTCTPLAGSLTCPVGTIQVDETVSITMTVRAVNGTRFNVATAIGDQVDEDFFNNTSFQQTTITPGTATFTVTSTADSGPGSLRQAIIDANANTGQRDTIAFNIGGGGAQTITLASALPNLTDSVIINGASQANPNGTPFIELNGNGLSAAGLTLGTGAGLSTIRGLAINRFANVGININAAAGGNVIEGNFIGTDPTGTIARPNGLGISVTSANNVIGGATAGARNVISGNTSTGISINTASASGNQVSGNIVGANMTGTAALPNGGGGISFSNAAANNLIGGLTAAHRNLISGNTGVGVQFNSSSSNNTIQGNFIGTDATGAAALPNTSDGVLFTGTTANNNVIGGAPVGAANVIAFNGGRGVSIGGGTGNRLVRNSIFSNGLIGIDLGSNGVTANDTGDGDTGANNLQNFPILTSVTPNGSQTSIQGTLNSTAQTEFTIEFFDNTVCDGSGNGEGRTLLGLTLVTTGTDGNVNFSVTLGASTIVTATATDPSGNTSEFSACRAPTVPPMTFTVLNTNDSGPGSLRQAMNDANANPGIDNIHFNIPGPGPHTISLLSELPNSVFGNAGMVIDGTTQPGWAAVQRPVIEIDGTNAGGDARGFVFGSGNSVLRGLAINRFGTGGTGGDRFLGIGAGVFLGGSGNSVVEGCFIGTDVTGTIARPNRNDGIAVLSPNNRIGGPSAAQRNVISANGRDGIFVSLGTGTPNVIQNNFIGVDVTGSVDAGNGANGVNVSSGPGATIQNNVIAGNNQNGIQFGTSVGVISGNVIGTNLSLASGLGNTLNGISFSAATGVPVTANTIAFNGSNGVLVSATSSTNNITANSIFSNGGLGIDLSPPGLTPNDAGDADTGANGLQNFPLLSSAQVSGVSTVVMGTLSSGSGTYRIDFYGNQTCDPSGNGEGGTFLGSTSVTTTGGVASFTQGVPTVVSGFVTATATDSTGNTSEFSPCRAVTLVSGGNLRAYITHRSVPSRVTVVNASLNSIVTTIPVGSSPFDVAVTASGSRALVTNNSSNSVSVINTATNTVIATITGVTSPFNIATNPARGLAYVTANQTTVYVIDTTANSIVTSVPVAGAFDVTVTPDGARAYVTSTTGNSVVAIDTATNTAIATIPIGGAAGRIDTSPAGDRVYVSRTTAGVRAVVVIDAATNTVVGTLPVTNADALAVTPDNTQVYVANFNGESITRISTSTLAVIGSFPSNSPEAIGMLSDGRAYIAEIDDGIISVVDLSTNTVTTSFTTAPLPTAIAVAPINIPPTQNFQVTNASDSGPGSFRQAILDANANEGAFDSILFNIPCPCPHTIALLSPLPVITDPVMIDASVNPGAAGVPVIELDGTNAGGASNGIHITAGSSVVRGLVINRFGNGGSGGGGGGIVLVGAGGNIIQGNFIGTDITGTIARPNRTDGVWMDGPSNVIGGDTTASPFSRNIISGNGGRGVLINGANATSNAVLGNYIGLDRTGHAGPWERFGRHSGLRRGRRDHRRDHRRFRERDRREQPERHQPAVERHGSDRSREPDRNERARHRRRRQHSERHLDRDGRVARRRRVGGRRAQHHFGEPDAERRLHQQLDVQPGAGQLHRNEHHRHRADCEPGRGRVGSGQQQHDRRQRGGRA